MKTFKTEINWVMVPEFPVRKVELFKIQFGKLGYVPVLVLIEHRDRIGTGDYVHYITAGRYDFEDECFYCDVVGFEEQEKIDGVAAWAYYDKIFEDARDAYLATMK